MNANLEAKKILKQLNFDFVTFTMEGFLHAAGQAKGREIITIPWEMPASLFGAWISDDLEAREYIFYRNDVSEPHQIHIQLHELSHFLFGHSTAQVHRERITDVIAGKASLPFDELTQLRSPKFAKTEIDVEVQAEALASLIQQQVILNSKLDLLIHDTSPEEKLAYFLKKMGVA